MAQAGKSNGEARDQMTLAHIYAEFRWGIKKAGMIGQVTYADLLALLEAAVKRIQKQVKDPVLMSKALVHFAAAKKTLEDLHEADKLGADVCPKCQLPRFICPCQEETVE